MRTIIRRIVVRHRIKAVSFLAKSRNANSQIVGDGNVDGTLQFLVIVIAVLTHSVAAIAAADVGIVRIDEHRATGCVLAYERALRTAIHFDVLDVIELLSGQLARKRGGAVAVQDHADRYLAVVLTLADAANVEVDALTQIVDRQVGSKELQIVDVQDAAVL